jgi:O-antigen/teichoic acid export membrane protein
VQFALAAACLTLIGGLLLCAAFPEWNIDPLVAPLAAAAFFVGMQEFARRLFLVQRRAVAALANDLTCHALRLCLLSVAYATQSMNPGTALWLIAGTSAFSAVTAAFAVDRNPSSTIATVREIAQEHWVFGKWLLAGSLAYWCGAQLILYVAASLLSVGVVGGMSAALSLTGAANVLFLGMENLVPPRAASCYRTGGPKALQRYVIRISSVGGLAILALMIVAGGWSEFWITLVFGTDYRAYSWLIWWWGLYHFIGFFQRPLSIALRVLNDTKAVYRSTLGGAAAAILVSVPAIQLHGVLGAMLAVCIVQVVTLMLLAHSYRQAIGGSHVTDVPSMPEEFPETARGLLTRAAV